MQISFIPKSGSRCFHFSLVGWRLKVAIGLGALFVLAMVRIGFVLASEASGGSTSAVLSWWSIGRDEAVAKELGALRAKIDLLESTISAMEGEIPKEGSKADGSKPASMKESGQGKPGANKSRDGLMPIDAHSAPLEIERLNERMEKISYSLERVLSHRENLAINLILNDSVPPIAAPITSGFGRRMDPFDGNPAFHRGIDFIAPAGTAVFALSSGVVESIGPFGGYGNVVVIRHNDRIVSRYAHLEGIEVTTGMAVLAGRRIGRVGSTGRSTGNHLHFEIEIDDRVVNPRPILERVRGRTVTAMSSGAEARSN